MLGYGVFTFLAPALLFSAGATAEGLYPKQSAVLNVDGKSYDKLVAKSNQVSPNAYLSHSKDSTPHGAVIARTSNPPMKKPPKV
ncbi:MAG: hypothetical protein Q9171_004868 [Xanthocarpia ochracea]